MMKKNFLFIATGALALASCSDSSPANDPVAPELAFQQQLIARNEFGRGEEFRYHLKEIAEDRSVPEVQSAAKQLAAIAEHVDQLAAKRIALIERLKKELVVEVGEEDMYTAPYETKNPLMPSLSKTQAAFTTDMISFDSGKGKELMEAMQSFRNELTETVSTYRTPWGDRSFSFKAPNIRQFKDLEDLNKQLDKALTGSDIAIDDLEAVRMIYLQLSRSESRWKELLHEECSWITAFHLLAQLEYEVLHARADALALIRSRVGGGEYGFNKILPLAAGPEYVKAGSEFDFEVFYAAFNSFKQPVVTTDVGSAQVISVRDGKALVRAKAPGSPCEITLTGKITIQNKSGIPKTMEWKKTVVVH